MIRRYKYKHGNITPGVPPSQAQWQQILQNYLQEEAEVEEANQENPTTVISPDEQRWRDIVANLSLGEYENPPAVISPDEQRWRDIVTNFSLGEVEKEIPPDVISPVEQVWNEMLAKESVGEEAGILKNPYMIWRNPLYRQFLINKYGIFVAQKMISALSALELGADASLLTHPEVKKEDVTYIVEPVTTAVDPEDTLPQIFNKKTVLTPDSLSEEGNADSYMLPHKKRRMQQPEVEESTSTTTTTIVSVDPKDALPQLFKDTAPKIFNESSVLEYERRPDVRVKLSLYSPKRYSNPYLAQALLHRRSKEEKERSTIVSVDPKDALPQLFKDTAPKIFNESSVLEYERRPGVRVKLSLYSPKRYSNPYLAQALLHRRSKEEKE